MTRRKLPQALSASDALWSSIMALTEPDELGRTLWLRAQAITGHPVSSLKKWATGERPVPLEVVEALDMANASAGGPATNREAWEVRHNSALAGLDIGGPEPLRYLERAVHDLAEAIRMVQFGKGGTIELRRMSIALTREGTELMEAIAIRADAEAMEDNRRHPRPLAPTARDRKRPARSRPHLVIEDDDQERVG